MVGNDNDENDDNDEGVNSLPDSGTSDDIDDIDESEGEGESDAEREWKESLQQLELLLTMVVVPYVGKYFGRKCAYWSEFLFLFQFAWGFWTVRGLLANEEGMGVNRLGKVHGVEVPFG